MEKLGYYNGKFGPLEEMQIPMLDRAFYFGDGVYDATYSRNYKIFAIDDHVERFYNSAAALRIMIPHTPDEMKALLCDMVKKVDTGDLFVYWQVSRGTAVRNHAFTEDQPGNIAIMLKPAKVKDIYSQVKLITEPDTRFLHCNLKTLNLIPSVMATQKAELMGCDEAILHRNGRVTECAHSNIHILKDGVLRTAPTDNLILPGIARKHLISMCHTLGIPVDETPFTVDDIFTADEVIMSSCTSMCRSAYEVDGKPVGGKAPELLKKLQDALLEEYLEATN
ncbi:MAG: D-amino acid aminotransferase [Ruminococcaceae bacterium]|nr:D-amino acid aminotransferase [Oscillospiraceae bacterium]